MSRLVAIIWLVALVASMIAERVGSVAVAEQQVIIDAPVDQQARIGDQALLKCKIKNLRGEPQWCIDDFCLGVAKRDHHHHHHDHHDNHKQDSTVFDKQHSPSASSSSASSSKEYVGNGDVLKGRPRYRIVGDKSKGEFHLLIEPVQLQDNMYFYCMATAASETIKAVKSNRVFLTVLSKPVVIVLVLVVGVVFNKSEMKCHETTTLLLLLLAYPQSLHLDNPVHVSLNRPSTIRCVAQQSRPPVRLLVAINGQIITDESKYKTQIVQTSLHSPRAAAAAAAASSTLDQFSEAGMPLVSSSSSFDSRRQLLGSFATISAEQLRTSYYDTFTNVTIDDVNMRMNGQVIECFAYSFMNGKHLYMLNANANANGPLQQQQQQQQQQRIAHLKAAGGFNALKNNVMNVKSTIQVDCKNITTLYSH